MINSEIEMKIREMKPFYVKDAIKNIFSWKELEGIINFRPLLNGDRFHIINQKQYTWPLQNWLSDVNTFPAEIIQEELQYDAAYLSDMSRANESINAICRKLELITGCPTDAHIYFCIAQDLQNTGFKIHWDWSHNLIVQIEGETNITVWNKSANNDDPREETTLEETPEFDIIMQPGDICFVPVKHYHRAISKTKRLSISFPSAPFHEYPKQDRTWIKLT